MTQATAIARRIPALPGMQVKTWLESQVHPSLADRPALIEGHVLFIGARLLASMVGLALLPVFLAFGGQLVLSVLAMVVSMLIMLAAAVVLSWTGRSALALGLSQIGVGVQVIGLSLAGADVLLALPWFLLMPAEAWIMREKAAIRASLALALPLAAGALIARAAGFSSVSLSAQTICLIGLMLSLPGPGLAFAAHLRRVSPNGRTGQPLSATDCLARLGDVILSIDLGRDASAIDHVAMGDLSWSGQGLFQRMHLADRPAYLKAISDAARRQGPEQGEPIALSIRLIFSTQEAGYSLCDLRVMRGNGHHKDRLFLVIRHGFMLESPEPAHNLIALPERNAPSVAIASPALHLAEKVRSCV
jgi:two-component system, cell cycle sensor histidine kinase DivJ